MSYNESLSANSNYPPMSQSQWDNAPFNQVDIPEKDFEITCSQSLSRTATVTTNNYIPGACGVDYEDDGDGGCCAFSWQDPDDFSNTDWSKEYDACGYKTPLQLIQILRGRLSNDLDRVDIIAEETNQSRVSLENELKHLIEECDCWCDDETEFILEG